MKILVTAFYTRGLVQEGGSSFFMKCIIDSLIGMGHDVVSASNPPERLRRDPEYNRLVREDYDLIICSHKEILEQIRVNPAPKVCISQGLVGPETFTHGADLYYSISEEAQQNNKNLAGIDSKIFPQPIKVPMGFYTGNDHLKNILIIRRYPVQGHDPFQVLSGKYNVAISDQSRPIVDQIKEADLCVTLGRGALEAMSHGKNVLVADKRPYMGQAFSDGLVTKENIHEITKNNFSGRRYKIDPLPAWLFLEVEKYCPTMGHDLQGYVRKYHDVDNNLIKLLDDVEKFKLRK